MHLLRLVLEDSDSGVKTWFLISRHLERTILFCRFLGILTKSSKLIKANGNIPCQIGPTRVFRKSHVVWVLLYGCWKELPMSQFVPLKDQPLSPPLLDEDWFFRGQQILTARFKNLTSLLLVTLYGLLSLQNKMPVIELEELLCELCTWTFCSWWLLLYNFFSLERKRPVRPVPPVVRPPKGMTVFGTE